MEISKDAQARLDNRVSRIVGDIDVFDSDKKEIVQELKSHFYDASMMHAESRGSKSIEREDIEAALADSEDPREVASGYMRAYVSSLARAGILSRTAAYVIDTILLIITAFLVVVLLTLPLIPIFPGGFYFNGDSEEGIVFTNPVAGIVFSTVWAIGVLATTLIYFVVLEGRFGYTPGKWLLGLRVLKDDGTRIGYVDSLLRNIPKLLGSSTVLVLDALLMVLLFRKDRQRGFDKIARTIVVHKNKKTKEAK